MQSESHKNAASVAAIAQADQIRGLCSVITKVARADLDAQLKALAVGISAIEHGVLRHLFQGVDSMAEISRMMGVAPSTLVYVVDGLTKKKLVRRGKDPKDRRREPLVLEKKGAELFTRLPQADSRSTLVRCLESMKQSHRRELVERLQELVNELHGPERLYLGAAPEEDKAEPAAVSTEANGKTGRRKRR